MLNKEIYPKKYVIKASQDFDEVAGFSFKDDGKRIIVKIEPRTEAKKDLEHEDVAYEFVNCILVKIKEDF
jgi:hypothetical protein